MAQPKMRQRIIWVPDDTWLALKTQAAVEGSTLKAYLNRILAEAAKPVLAMIAEKERNTRP